MQPLRSPKPECRSQGPFLVPDGPSLAGSSEAGAMKCPLCGAVGGFFEVRHADTPTDRYEQTLSRVDPDPRDIRHSLDDERNDVVLRRLETALWNLQSSLTPCEAGSPTARGAWAAGDKLNAWT